MAEVVVFDIDAQSAIQKLAQLRADTNALKEAQKQLAEEVKKGNKDAATSYEANAIILKNVANEQRVLSRAVEGYSAVQKNATDTTNFANNSIQENRDLLKQLTATYIGLKNPTAEQTQQIKKLSDQLKVQESAIGDNRRSVGAYAEEIKKAFGELKIGGVQLNQLKDGLNASKSAFTAAGGGVKGFSAALATTGIPIVITAVQKLIDVFSAFKPVADAVENVINGLSAGFKALIDGGNIGEAVRQSNALLETLRDLEDTQNAYNISQARGKNEIDRLIIASKDRTKTEAERTAALEKAEALEKELYNNSVKRNTDLLKSQQNDLKAKLGLTDAELKALAESTNATDKAFQDAKSKAEARTGFDEEALKKYQDTLKERAELDGESAKFLERVVNQKNKLIEKEEEEADKATEEKKKRLEKQKADREKYEQDINKLVNDFILDERQKIEAQFAERLALIKGNGEQEKALRIAIKQAENDALLVLEADRIAKEKKLRQEGLTKNTELFTAAIDELILKEKNAYLEKQKTNTLTLEDTQKFNEELNKLELEKLEAQQAALELAGENTNAIEQQIADFKINTNKELVESQLQTNALLLAGEQELQDARIANAQAASGLLSELVGQQTILGKLFLTAEKAAAIAQIIINTQREISGISSFYAPFGPAGLATAAGLIVAAKVKAGISIATIAAQTIKQVALPKKAEGGEISIDGKSHSQGGEVVTVGGRPVAEVEGGEGLYVMKKNAYQKIKQFSAINEAFGGKSWMKGSSKYLADGGAINTTLPILESRGRVNSTIEQNRILSQALRQLPAPVLSIKEFEKKQAVKDKSVRISEL
jgi:hypothetical protein